MFLPSNPDMVMMDTEIIAESPVRLTVAGMGDALATYFKQERVRDQMPHPVQAERLPGQLWLLQNCVLIR